MTPEELIASPIVRAWALALVFQFSRRVVHYLDEHADALTSVWLAIKDMHNTATDIVVALYILYTNWSTLILFAALLYLVPSTIVRCICMSFMWVIVKICTVQ